MTEKCICKGNLQKIIERYEPLLDTYWKCSKGKIWKFYGIVIASDDYYYAMYSEGQTDLLSCVGSIEGFGFKQISMEEVTCLK